MGFFKRVFFFLQARIGKQFCFKALRLSINRFILCRIISKSHLGFVEGVNVRENMNNLLKWDEVVGRKTHGNFLIIFL